MSGRQLSWFQVYNFVDELKDNLEELPLMPCLNIF